MFRGSPPQPVVVRAVAAVLAGGREGSAVPQPQLDPGNSLHLCPESASTATALPMGVAAMTLPKLRLQPVVTAGVGAAGTFLAAVWAATVAPLRAVGCVVRVGGSQRQPRRQVSQHTTFSLPLCVLVVSR